MRTRAATVCVESYGHTAARRGRAEPSESTTAGSDDDTAPAHSTCATVNVPRYNQSNQLMIQLSDRGTMRDVVPGWISRELWQNPHGKGGLLVGVY